MWKEKKKAMMMRATETSRDDEPRATSFGSLLLWSGTDLCEEVILPEQLHPPIRIQHKHRGQVALLYAILSDAIRCFLEGKSGQTPARGRAAREAEEWLFIDDEEWPFSFVNICEFLGLDPTYVRRGLRGGNIPRPQPRGRPFVHHFGTSSIKVTTLQSC